MCLLFLFKYEDKRKLLTCEHFHEMQLGFLLHLAIIKNGVTF